MKNLFIFFCTSLVLLLNEITISTAFHTPSPVPVAYATTAMANNKKPWCSSKKLFSLFAVLGDDANESATIITSPSVARGKKVLNGALLAPAMITAPLYGIGFGVLGHNKMWAFSKWIYSFTNSNESWVHDHFDSMQKFLKTGRNLASEKSRSYSFTPPSQVFP